uniref:Uncharacterized protein n=1 Tax=Rhizophora mucronata TaxID=61149 RepID=A0A2P2Q6A1_RHIMU
MCSSNVINIWALIVGGASILYF